MLIILEGANGVGKTTLTHNLGFEYIHFPTGDNKCSESILNHHLYTDHHGLNFRRHPYPENAQKYARLDILSNLHVLNEIAQDKIVISDRSLLSNLIYSSNQHDKVIYEYLNAFTCEVIFIILYADNVNLLIDRIMSRKKDDDLTNKLMTRIKNQTRNRNQAFKNYNLDSSQLESDISIFKIPIDNLNPDQMVEKIKSIIN